MPWEAAWGGGGGHLAWGLAASRARSGNSVRAAARSIGGGVTKRYRA